MKTRAWARLLQTAFVVVVVGVGGSRCSCDGTGETADDAGPDAGQQTDAAVDDATVDAATHDAATSDVGVTADAITGPLSSNPRRSPWLWAAPKAMTRP